MTRYIPEQDRVSGMFPVGVNGVTSYFRVGHLFEENASLLSALSGAGIVVEIPAFLFLNGEWTGRIKITSVLPRILLVVNGLAIGHVPANAFFTPTEQQLQVIADSNLVWEKELGPISASAAQVNDQIFPTPGFTDTTGVVSLFNYEITEGNLVCADGDGVAIFTPLRALVEGIYEVVLTETSLQHCSYGLTLGDAIHGDNWGSPPTHDGTGTVSTFQMVVSDPSSNQIVINEPNGLPHSLTACTITRIS